MHVHMPMHPVAQHASPVGTLSSRHENVSTVSDVCPHVPHVTTCAGSAGLVGVVSVVSVASVASGVEWSGVGW